MKYLGAAVLFLAGEGLVLYGIASYFDLYFMNVLFFGSLLLLAIVAMFFSNGDFFVKNKRAEQSRYPGKLLYVHPVLTGAFLFVVVAMTTYAVYYFSYY
jgi:hypothetical protein